MLKFEQAYKLVLQNAGKLASERVAANEAIGRILAEDIKSRVIVPPFAKSAMDGFAVKTRDLAKVPVSLKLAGEIAAGSKGKFRYRKNTCVRIMTGAPVPKGYDAVAKVEDTKFDKAGGVVRFEKKVCKGQNICQKGEDLRRGRIVLRSGECMGAAHVGLLATLGKLHVRVAQQPTIAILATGDELVDIGVEPTVSQIRDANRPMLLAYFSSLGYETIDLGIARDNRKDLLRKISKGLEADIVLISGGVSMGEYDLVPKVFGSLRISQIFHNVFIKPGKPLWFGKKGSTLVFGLPGNPVSSLLASRIFVLGAINAMLGARVGSLELLVGRITASFTKHKGRKTFRPVVATFGQAGYDLELVKYNGSADIRAVTEANAFVMLDGEQERFKRGEAVQFIKL